MSKRAPVLLLACLPVLAGGCDNNNATALRIKLVTNPQLNSEAQVLAVIGRLQLTFDKPGGFSKASDGLVLEDLDGDGEMELLFSQDVDGDQRFPLLRLRPGDTPHASMTVAARGLAGTQLAAVGASVNAEFVRDQDSEISVPLDLRSQYRPPRVLTTLPQEGQDSVPTELSQVYLVFSRWMNPASIVGHLNFRYQGSAGDESLAGDWELSNSSVIENGLPEQRTIATFRLASCALSPGPYLLEADPQIRDLAGNGLDQIPATQQPEGFVSGFSLPGAPDANACRAPVGCEENSDCDSTVPPRYICVPQDGPNKCVPAPDSCDGSIRRPPGYRCDEVEGQVTCTRDAFRCSTNDQCGHPDLRCAGEGDFVGRCVPRPLNCEDVVCPGEFECILEEGRTLACVEPF